METEKKIRKYSAFCRICSSFMVIILLVSLGMPVCAATAQATTMKLEKTEGDVTLKTQNGTKRKITNGMRLYNGNSVTTVSDSYAYISLDSTKAAKLDQKSAATLRQSGKKLELLVKSGSLFFNVSSHLADDESMNIRTSTMVTGVRGTCGVVEYINPNKSRLYLIEGQVTLGSGSNATTVYGGETATVVLREKQEQEGQEKPGESEYEYQVTVDKMTEKDVPVFAITEILSDVALQERIEQTTDLKIAKFQEVYDEYLNPTDPEEEEEETQPTIPVHPYYPGGIVDEPIIEEDPTTGEL